ncbi:MAG TPA: glycosyltransferase family 4 protein [Streptosporangiaceae bacterium]|nr:glycosyltransferase family 4 protein [Streptosporangiaceae bacterium]
MTKDSTREPAGEPGVRCVTFVLAATEGGTGVHVRSLAAGLAGRGVEVTVAGPAGTERMFGFTGAGARFVPVEISDRPRPGRDFAAVAALRRLLRAAGAAGRADGPAGGPVIVHAHGLRAGAVSALALGGAIRRARQPAARRGAPVLVVTVHNAPPPGGAAGTAYGVLERIVARRADRVLCVSADLVTRMRRRGAHCAGLAVVPAPARPAVSAGTARAVRAGLGAAGRPFVFACGRLAAQKGFGTLLGAAGLLRDRDPRPLVAIAGSGPLAAELARRIDAERLPLRLLGQRGDVPALLAAADVFVLPSRWEGQPLILQEALRAGAAIVASRTGGIPALTGEDAALLVPAGDSGALAAALLRVLTEPGLAKRLAAAAAERARSLPGEEAAVDAVLADYTCAAGP